MTDIDTRETTNEGETEGPKSDVAEAAERVVDTLFDVGRLWAAHGLGVGRSALETSATTLKATAELLGELGEKLRRRDAEA